LEQELGKPRTDWIIVGKSPRNRSGVVGVRRAIKKYKGKEGQIFLNEVYEVTWNAGREKRGRTSVSITKYGEMSAFRRACAIRRQKRAVMKRVSGRQQEVKKPSDSRRLATSTPQFGY